MILTIDGLTAKEIIRKMVSARIVNAVSARQCSLRHRVEKK